MEEYSVGVALFDYLPVAATATALWLLASGIAARHRALALAAAVSAFAVVAGGFCKATWKLLIALDYPPLDWLNNMLFLAMAPGFAALGYCLWQAGRAWRGGTDPASASHAPAWLLLWVALPLAAAVAASTILPESRAWFFLLLGYTTLASIFMAVTAARLSHWSGTPRWVVACFIYSPLASIALSGLSRLPPGEATAWMQETVNLSAQLALAFGAWGLWRKMTSHQPVTAK